MGYLNRIFGSTLSIAEKSVKDEAILIKSWNDYIKTVPKKEELIIKLPFLFGEKRVPLQKLSELIELELVDIKLDEKEEDDLIKNIHVLAHSKKIRRVERLDECLGYVATKYEYVHSLLFHLYAILKSESNIIEKMKDCNLKKYRILTDKLKSDLAVEKKILEKIKEISTFHNLLIDLVKCEKVIKTMDDNENKLYKMMKVEMKQIFADKLKKGLLFNLVSGVYNAIQYKYRNAIGNAHNLKPEGFDCRHYASDLEFVNRPEFVTLVKQMIKIQKISDQMSEESINVFVHIFREWYNQ